MIPFPSQILRALVISAALTATAFSPSAHAAGSLEPNDLVAICGDSITEQRLYSMFIEDYLLMCQPQPGLQAMQAGWSGERAPGFLSRMKDDVLPFKPTVATTCYGMNDGGYAAITPEIAKAYRDSMQGIIDTFKQGGVRFLVIGGPGAVDTDTYAKKSSPEIYNKTLSELTDIARELAEKNGANFADVHGAMIKTMAAAKAKYGPSYHVGGGDGVHPSQNGHLIMAYAFLKGLGCDGNIGTFTLDQKAGKATASDGHKVLSSSATEIELESTRYPFCFFGDPANPGSTTGIIEFLPFNQDLNRLMLVVNNATAPKLKVTWGTKSKEYAAADLEKGINLAAEFLSNPFSKPFQTVETAIAEQQRFDTTATKTLLHGLPDWKRLLPEQNESYARLSQALIEKEAGLRAAARKVVVPVKHKIVIEPVQ